MSLRGSTVANRYDRADFGEGLLGWVYEYVNTEPVVRKGGMATGLEIGVQLAGDWVHASTRQGHRAYGPGEAHLISPGERYSLSMRARPSDAGLQVGFIVYPDESGGIGAEEGDVVFSPAAKLDRTFFEFCRAYQVASDAGAGLPAREVRAEVRSFVKKNVEIAPRDPLAAAKRAMDETFARPLYLEHLASVAEMHPRTFARRFSARYGTTPIAYRLQLRLNEAARLSWTEPTLPLRALAERVGFEDMPYFHRAFIAEFGVTPAVYGRRGRLGDRNRAALTPYPRRD